jgi:hypothetical protein
LVPFLGTMGGRPTSWFTQELPFMNKTSWPKLYAASQHKSSKPARTLTQSVGSTPNISPRIRVTSYANMARTMQPANTESVSATPSQATWTAPTPTSSIKPIDPPTEVEVNKWTISTSNPSDLFCALLMDKPNDPKRLPCKSVCISLSHALFNALMETSLTPSVLV